MWGTGLNGRLRPTSYASGMSVTFDAKQAILGDVYIPQYNTASMDTYFSGITRLYGNTLRSGTRLIGMFGVSPENKARVWDATFMLPYNMVLRKAGYQGNDDTPTQGAAKATADVCAKLKGDYDESNLRIYVIKYRAQTQYKSFPMYGITQSNKDHDYTAVDGCATSGYLYTVSTEADLKTRLNAIATNIKSWAGYEAAKLVE